MSGDASASEGRSVRVCVGVGSLGSVWPGRMKAGESTPGGRIREGERLSGVGNRA